MPKPAELLAEAVRLFGLQDFEKALEAYRRLEKADPRSTDALHGIAMCHFRLGRLDEAIAAAKRILEVDPADSFAHTSLSMFYQRKGMIQEAEAEAAKARTAEWRREIEEG
jgi:tetratricopeptide (TPR) repeat protein